MNKMWREREEIDNPSSEDIQSWIQTLHHKNKDFFYWKTPIGAFGVHNVNKQRVTIAFAKQEHRFKNKEIYGSLLDPAFLDSNKKIKVSADPWGNDIYLRETVTKDTAVVVLTYFHEHLSFPDGLLWSRKWEENRPVTPEQMTRHAGLRPPHRW